MTNLSTPGFELPPILSNTPLLIEMILQGFGTDTLEWRPNAARWSAAMVIAHLAESEVNCFRLRLIRTAFENFPTLERYDQWAFFRNGNMRSAHDALSELRHERSKTLAFLRGLPSSVRDCKCQHHTLGVLTFAELLNEFAFHDMGHLRQILELCRARAYYPAMGVWQSYYQVNP